MLWSHGTIQRLVSPGTNYKNVVFGDLTLTGRPCWFGYYRTTGELSFFFPPTLHKPQLTVLSWKMNRLGELSLFAVIEINMKINSTGCVIKFGEMITSKPIDLIPLLLLHSGSFLILFILVNSTSSKAEALLSALHLLWQSSWPQSTEIRHSLGIVLLQPLAHVIVLG